MATDLVLLAPFSAWITQLDEIPDAAFAERMLGDGVALDPLDGEVRAPCDGVVAAIAPTGHSVTVRSRCGIEVLIHVGVDTVALHGQGFEACVALGAEVQAGDSLLRFDLDVVGRVAKSLMTPMLVLTEGLAVTPIVMATRVCSGDPICRVAGAMAANTSARTLAKAEPISRAVDVLLPHGLHARPAARIVASLKPYSAEVSLEKNGASVNARSITAILSLGIGRGDRICIRAQGVDAVEAIGSVAQLIVRSPQQDHSDPIEPAKPVRAANTGEIAAVRAAPGAALGQAFRLVPSEIRLPEGTTGPTSEKQALIGGIERLCRVLATASRNSDVAEAHLAIIDDPDMLSGALREIDAGANASQAWRTMTRTRVEKMRATGNPRLIERTADLIDCERRVLAVLSGGDAEKRIEVPEGCILIADELLPSDFLAIEPKRLAGIATAGGGPTSHVAILAASRGVPMLVGAGPSLLEIADGTHILLDASRAIIAIEPSADRIEAHLSEAARRANATEALFQRAQRPARTADGVPIEVFANCGSVAEARQAVAAGAEGCGLLRTEFLFLDRPNAPTIDEQAEMYGLIASEFGDRPVILRTLDAGSDKPLPYLPLPREDNPALGMRGLRVSAANSALLTDQFRAILRGVPKEQRRILLPMVNDLGEFRTARRLLRDVEKSEGAGEPTPLGIMIETPSAALLAEQLAAEADFLSIGTNDLAQYTLAVDRAHPSLAGSVDALHPAVLRLIAEAVRGGRVHGRRVSVCGAAASDADAAPLLIGLGIGELSAPAALVPELKDRISRLNLQACGALAAAALADEIDAVGVRRLVKGFLEEDDDA